MVWVIAFGELFFGGVWSGVMVGCGHTLLYLTRRSVVTPFWSNGKAPPNTTPTGPNTTHVQPRGGRGTR